MNAIDELNRLMASNQAIALSTQQRSDNSFLVRYKGIGDGGYTAERLSGGELSIRVQTAGVPAIGQIGIASRSNGVAPAWF
ncbi:MAG: hypothetical protein AAFX78_05075 [Cyanobacteria bacterium J06638_20]